MVRTSTAEKNHYICPACGDELKQDNSGRGYVAHVSNSNCQFERGQKDGVGPSSLVTRPSLQPAPPKHQPAAGVRVCGYSERGVFNALLYEIGFSPDPLDALTGLLSLISFPGSSHDFSRLQGVEILVEQSLSDFGDADAILLLHGPDWRTAVFIEGKVKTSQLGRWTTRDAWREFLARKGGKLDSSNLFTQLYHKVQFVSALRSGGIAGLEYGVRFPECSKKTVRKLGANPVVCRAAKMIEPYTENALYISVVPDATADVADFYSTELRKGPASDVTGWDTTGWGYLSWAQVEEFCRQHGFVNTQRVFDFNRGQIY